MFDYAACALGVLTLFNFIMAIYVDQPMYGIVSFGIGMGTLLLMDGDVDKMRPVSD